MQTATKKEVGEQTGEAKARKARAQSLIGKWEDDTVIGEHVFVVKAVTTLVEKDIRAAISDIAERGMNTDGLVVLAVTRERPASVQEVKRTVVKF